MASTSSVWPLPWTPAIATISPARTSSDTPLTATWSRSSRTTHVLEAQDDVAGHRRTLDDAQLDVAPDHQVRELLARGRLRLDGAGDRDRGEGP